MTKIPLEIQPIHGSSALSLQMEPEALEVEPLDFVFISIHGYVSTGNRIACVHSCSHKWHHSSPGSFPPVF